MPETVLSKVKEGEGYVPTLIIACKGENASFR